jgi:hypothetical protein
VTRKVLEREGDVAILDVAISCPNLLAAEARIRLLNATLFI